MEINFGPEALTAYLFLGNQLNPTLKPHINRKSDPKMKASTLICLSLTATTSKQRRFLLQILYEKASSALFQGYPLWCANLHNNRNGKTPHNSGKQNYVGFYYKVLMKKHPLHYFKATPYNVPNFTLIEMEKPLTIVESKFPTSLPSHYC